PPARAPVIPPEGGREKRGQGGRSRPPAARTGDPGGIGGGVTRTPSPRTASATALAIAAGAPIVPPSPMPLTPPGITGEGVSRWTISNGGTSSAFGKA